MVVAALRLDGLDDQSHAGVPNLLLPLQSLLNQRQTPLVLSLVLSRVLFQRVPLKELSSTVGPNNTVSPSWGYAMDMVVESSCALREHHFLSRLCYGSLWPSIF